MIAMQSLTKKSTVVLLGCFALAGLASCSGGGGSGGNGPGMIIQPPLDHPDTIAQAAAITVGKTITGTLRSPDDVDFFRLPLTGPGTVTFWTTGEADTVLTLLDREGNDPSLPVPGTVTPTARQDRVVLAVAASSEGRVSVTTALDNVFVRVTGRSGGRIGGYDLHNEFESISDPSRCEGNRPPYEFTLIGTVTVSLDRMETVDLGEHFVDPESNPLIGDPTSGPLTYTFTSQDTSVATGAISEGVLTIRGHKEGHVSASVTATDPCGLTGSADFSIEVVNRPPQTVSEAVHILKTSPTQVINGETVTLGVAPYFTDPDGHDLTYSAESEYEPVVTVSISRTSGALMIHGHSAPGLADVEVTARDPGGLTASFRFTVHVTDSEVLRGPVVLLKIPEQTVDKDETATLDLARYFTHPDGDDRITYYNAVSSDDSVATATVSDTGGVVTIRGHLVGTVTVSVTAGESSGGPSASQDFTVRVRSPGRPTEPEVRPPGRPPERRGLIPNQILPSVGDSVSLDLSLYFTNPEGGAMTYTAYECTPFEPDFNFLVIGSLLTITKTDTAILGNSNGCITASNSGGLTGRSFWICESNDFCPDPASYQ